MQRPWETIKVKILLGYVFLISIAAFTVWLIYSEILLYSGNKTRISNLNNKILYFNSVLTNLYQAETLERMYSQTGKPVHFENYRRLMNVIHVQIDSLSAFSNNPVEKVHTDSILSLLEKKRTNLQELISLKRAGSSDDLIERAMMRLTSNRDSINELLNIYRTVTQSRDTTVIIQKKKKFLERLMYAFKPQNKGDSVLQIKSNQQVLTDSLITVYNPTDTVFRFLNAIMQDMRDENMISERQLELKEKEALANDRVITLQLRQILSLFEKDMLVNSINEISMLQDRIKLTTWYLIALGILAFVIILIFLILILKDISKSQRYRSELEKAKQYSDSLLKSKEQIMLSITHDIKSPLASVMGYARLMADASYKEQQLYYLENINKSSEHILKLVNDLVDLTRLETGKLKIEPVNFNLYTLVHETYVGFQPLAAAKNLDLKLVSSISQEQEFISDPVRVKQILGNILSNAIKYTEKGSVTISVKPEKIENANFIRFDITDTGIGISEEDSKTIFNEFSQVAFNNRQRHDGAGLGLTISQRLVGLLKGNITLVSQPGKGSCFTVILPLEPGVQISKQQPVANDILLPQTNIMVVDDDEIFLNLTTETLQRSGFQVFPCNSPAMALKTIQSNKINLIITDIQMPGMTGTELLAYLQRKTGKYLPVIAISGQDDFNIQMNPDVKISAVVKKPFLPDVLLVNINAVLKRDSPNGLLRQNISEMQHAGDVPYSLNLINQFAADDNDSIQKILTSFVESCIENISLLEKYLLTKDREAVAELAHKMLAMFRQLEATQIVESMLAIEGKEKGTLKDDQWVLMGGLVIEKIEQLIDKICEDQHIYIRNG